MECRWERSGALKRILLQSGFADLHSKARSVRQRISSVFHPHSRKTEQVLPNTIHLACLHETANLLAQKVRNGRIHVQARNPPTGPSHACGAMRIPDASAATAVFHSAVIPPTWAMSG